MTIQDIKNLSSSPYCINLIGKLYKNVNEDDQNFNQWYLNFIDLHGLLDKQKKVDIEELCIRYKVEINNDSDLFKLIYVLESFYVFILRLFIYQLINKEAKDSGILRIIQNELPQQFSINSGYLDVFNNVQDVEQDITEIYQNLIVKIDFKTSFDVVRELYEDLFDKRIRHSMGEFFTPDWLAEIVIKKTVGKSAITDKKFLDPTCGSGTFIRNVLRKYAQETDGEIFFLIYGIDINPVSVLAAKTNYLIEFINYFNNISKLPSKLPIYEADLTKEISYILTDNRVHITDEIGKVDFIIGNPPWVNWEYLPTTYKEQTYQAWKYFGLYEGKGLDANFLKEDISCLITYISIHKYLKDSGRLGFLLKESILKSVRQAKSFRNFKLVPEYKEIKLKSILDLTNLSPFEGINPRTIALFLIKDQVTTYPVPYTVVKTKDGKKRFDNDVNLEEIKGKLIYEDLLASPSDLKDRSSALMTLPENELNASRKIAGKSAYKARTGVFTGGGNAIFWMNILGKNDNGFYVENITERAKNKVKKIKSKLEDNYLFPFVTGKDLNLWEYSYNKYIVCPHTAETKMYPIDIEELQNYPLMSDYFNYFKEDLLKRKGFTGLDKHIHLEYFYTLQRIGDYTFSPYKVGWKYISSEFTPVVIEDVNDSFLGLKTCIPNEKVIYIGLQNKKEAYYLCGLLSSTIFRKTIESFMIGTQITPSIISKLRIEKFNSDNHYHLEISQHCYDGHKKPNDKEKYLKKIDLIVNDLFK